MLTHFLVRVIQLDESVFIQDRFDVIRGASNDDRNALPGPNLVDYLQSIALEGVHVVLLVRLQKAHQMVRNSFGFVVGDFVRHDVQT